MLKASLIIMVVYFFTHSHTIYYFLYSCIFIQDMIRNLTITGLAISVLEHTYQSYKYICQLVYLFIFYVE